MTKYVKDEAAWKQSLTAEDFLTLTTKAVLLLQAKVDEFDVSAEVELKDGSELKAQSIAELTHDLQNVTPHEIKDLQLNVASEGVTTHLRSRPMTTWSAERTTLTTSGVDEALVYGLHGQLERAIAKRFDDLAEARRQSEQTQTPPSISIMGTNVSISGTGDASSSSNPPAPQKTSERWWNNKWVIALVGGTAAILAAAWIGGLLGGLFSAHGVAPPNPSAAAAQRKAIPTNRSIKPTMVAYRGTNFTAQIPAKWNAEELEVHKSSYVSSSWYDPSNPTDKLLIDWSSPTAGRTLQQDAQPVYVEVSQDPGYEQLYYGPGNLSSVDSWMWEFRVNGHQDIDYFLQDCSMSFAVFGSADPVQFNQLRSAFRESAGSLRATCP